MHTDNFDLKIYQELTLLALCEKKGTVTSSYFNFALAGAVLAELILLQKLRVQSGRKQLVEVVDSKQTGDLMLDSFLDEIGQSKRQRNLKSWVPHFSRRKDLRQQAVESLIQKGIVAREEQTVLWLFKRNIYPEVNGLPEQQLRQRMREAIKFSSGDVEPDTAILIALTYNSRMLNNVLGRQTVKRYRKRIEQISNGERVAAATKEVIAACEAAMFVAVIMPAMTTTVVSS
ncbi:MAG: GPP34 family phosphoprotein [Idiomarina sp.]|nr:GPP34 family phosphoprotein [Idiomarina sp.]